MFIIHVNKRKKNTKELAKLKFSNINSAQENWNFIYLFSEEELLNQFEKDILEITYLKVSLLNYCICTYYFYTLLYMHILCLKLQN